MKPSLGWLVLLAVGFLGWLGVSKHLRDDGALREQIHAREVTIAALARQSHATDMAYVRDTIHLYATRIQYARLRDTLRITDTVAVKSFMAVTDSTIHACSVALLTCERRVAVRDSIIAATNDLLALERKRGRGFRFLGVPLGCVGGGVAGTQGVGAGIGCGIPLLK